MADHISQGEIALIAAKSVFFTELFYFDDRFHGLYKVGKISFCFLKIK